MRLWSSGQKSGLKKTKKDLGEPFFTDEIQHYANQRIKFEPRPVTEEEIFFLENVDKWLFQGHKDEVVFIKSKKLYGFCQNTKIMVLKKIAELEKQKITPLCFLVTWKEKQWLKKSVKKRRKK